MKNNGFVNACFADGERATDKKIEETFKLYGKTVMGKDSVFI